MIEFLEEVFRGVVQHQPPRGPKMGNHVIEEPRDNPARLLLDYEPGYIFDSPKPKKADGPVKPTPK